MARHDVVHERQTDILFYHNISLVLASAPMNSSSSTLLPVYSLSLDPDKHIHHSTADKKHFRQDIEKFRSQGRNYSMAVGGLGTKSPDSEIFLP